MAQQNFQRFPSVVFTSDEDEDQKECSMDLQFSTPRAHIVQSNELSSIRQETATSVHRVQIIIPPSTPIRRSSSRQRTTTATQAIKKEVELIDITTPKKQPMIVDQPHYIPRTIYFSNEQRLSILPTYPKKSPFDGKSYLLLANVPGCQLSMEQLALRQPGKIQSPFEIIDLNPISESFFLQQYHTLYVPVLQRFKLDLSIIDHNYARLKNVINLFYSARRRILSSTGCSQESILLNDTEYPYLLEFYLQMDVDLFYMKTCSYFDAKPRSSSEGIFCSHVPECRYKMSKCEFCNLCVPSQHGDYRQQPPVLFNRYGRHRFVNGYESILNCPVSCNTKNFIYVLTCVCGQYDYISETKFTLEERFNGHRKYANYLIRKCLISESNLKKFGQTNSEASTSSATSSSNNKNQMLLYKHPIQCSAAIQMFLDKNPSYWPFVPMLMEEANQENIMYQRMSMARTTTATNMHLYERDERIKTFLSNISKPPHNYKFSDRQIEKQVDFFKNNLINEPFDHRVDIFNATIIAVLPPNTSDAFRQIIHSLFVTHTEAKLNTLGHFFDHPTNYNVRNGLWCSNLVRRPK